MKGAREDSVTGLWRRLLDEKVPEKRRPDVAYVALEFAELAGCRLDWGRAIGGIDVTKSAVANEMISLGAMQATRADLRRGIQLRFPEILTPDVERAIADQPSLDLLRAWIDASYTATTPEEFLAVLRR
jgi:hypothetical protein